MAKKTQTFTVTGVGKIDRKLKDLEKKDIKKIVNKALRLNLKPVQKDAKKGTPRDTGEARRSVKLRAGKRSRVKIHMYVRLMWDVKEMRPYPAYVEYGSPHVPPVGMLRKAYDRNKAKTKKNTMRDIMLGVDAAIALKGAK